MKYFVILAMSGVVFVACMCISNTILSGWIGAVIFSNAIVPAIENSFKEDVKPTNKETDESTRN